jgi:uncharacterized membrane protein SpoIIM required for sporulation
VYHRAVDLNRFLGERTPRWTELEGLLERVERGGLHTLPVAEAQRFAALYRTVSGDLMVARTRTANAEVVDYLNDLVARAYVQVYRSPRLRLDDARRFYRSEFPRELRAHGRLVALAAACLLAGGALGAAGVSLDPSAAPYLLPEGHADIDPVERVREEESGGVQRAGAQASFSSFLFTHNMRVSFLVFALGLTLGIGTVALLFMNGVMLGSLAAAYHAAGEGLFFWAWILPHGIPELTAIFIAGGAGLVLARGVIAPGGAARGPSVRAAGRASVRLVLGLLPILVVAGVIEGTLSQVHEPILPYPLKIAFALVGGALLYAWLLRGGGARGAV